MSERYKTITFDNFSGNEQCDLVKSVESSFKSSNNLVIQDNKIKLGKKTRGGALVSSTLNEIGGANGKLAFMYGGYLYFLGTDGNDCFIKKSSVSTGAWTAVVTLLDSGSIVKCFIKFRNLVVVNYYNNADNAYLVKYSTNGMTMTTFADTNLMALSGVSTFNILSYKIIHDRLYILGSDRKIYYSDDGITFVLLSTLDSSYSYGFLEYLSGYLYVVNNTTTSVFGLVRISLTGDIQDEVVSLSQSFTFSHSVFAGNSYIILHNRYLYRVEGDDLVLIFDFGSATDFLPSQGFIDKLFFIKGSLEIIEMSIDEKMSRPYDVLDSGVLQVCALYKKGDYVTGLQDNDSSKACVSIYEDYVASGDIQTRCAKLKAQGVPKQLVLRHAPLTANAWVKVYVKVDRAAAWGSAVITSDALNAVKKTYDFPAGTELDFIEFKIEYGTDDSSETPEDAILDFIYLPTGLANSK